MGNKLKKKMKKAAKALREAEAMNTAGLPTPRAWGGEPGIGKSALIMLDEFASIFASPATADDNTFPPMLAPHMSAQLGPLLRATVKPSKRQWKRWARANPRAARDALRVLAPSSPTKLKV